MLIQNDGWQLCLIFLIAIFILCCLQLKSELNKSNMALISQADQKLWQLDMYCKCQLAAILNFNHPKIVQLSTMNCLILYNFLKILFFYKALYNIKHHPNFFFLIILPMTNMATGSHHELFSLQNLSSVVVNCIPS